MTMTMDISFRASSLGSYESCPKKFAAEFIISAGLAGEFGLPRDPRPTHIGAIVGSASHAGFATIMREFKRTGEHGGKSRANHAISVAGAEYAQIVKEAPGVMMDSTTPSKRDGAIAANKIVERFHADRKIFVEPVIIESGMAATVRHDDGEFRLTGTFDAFLVDGVLEDHKTGRNRPKAHAQIGVYTSILKANDAKVTGARINYGRRVQNKLRQPPTETIEIITSVAEQHAKTIAMAAHRDVKNMIDRGSPGHIVANPSCYLCSPKFCPAYGTAFCRIGISINK